MTITKKQSDSIVLDINEIFFDIDSNLEVVLAFYTMFQPNYRKGNQFKYCFRNIILPCAFKNAVKKKSCLVEDVNNIQLDKEPVEKMPETLFNSNFSMIGVVKIHKNNGNLNELRLQNFNFYSIFEDKIHIDSELTYE